MIIYTILGLFDFFCLCSISKGLFDDKQEGSRDYTCCEMESTERLSTREVEIIPGREAVDESRRRDNRRRDDWRLEEKRIVGDDHGMGELCSVKRV
ncbi:hypothetical protein L6452_14406 [Arctium lappa]|uniref:Uncharacterized protein n=1 Tax=Arctium lappa TaxID=4217 RepID=A0ACB9CKT8_ARCLA|nr:hypothetical protein L6452_14406 [Arctium lappa]